VQPRPGSDRPSAPPTAQPQRPQPPQQPTARPQQPPAPQQPAASPQQPQQPAARPGPATTPPAAQAPQRPDRRPGRPPDAPTSAQPIAPPSTAPERQGPRRVEELRNQRQQQQVGNRTIIREPGRTIIREGDRTIIRHNDADRFRRNARDVQVQQRGGNTLTTIVRPDGTRIVSVVDDNGRLIRRVRRDPRGREIVIIDSRPHRGPAAIGIPIISLGPPVLRIPRERYIVEADRADRALIYETFVAPPVERLDRAYTLEEIRYSPELRDRVRRVDIDTITFDTGSWEIAPDQAAALAEIADAMRRAIERNQRTAFLIEGHTDAVGQDVDNLSLSDRRAEAVAQILSEQFGVPPENLVTQGYGEQYLKIPTEGPERRNRRVAVRNITQLMTGQAAAAPR
jgi:outer membrane protein OmpA-like peptidoglycan-associated protein